MSLGSGFVYYSGVWCVLFPYSVQPSQINKCIVFLLQQVPSFPGPAHPQRAAHVSNDHSMKTWNPLPLQPGSLWRSVRQQLGLWAAVTRVSLLVHFDGFLLLLKPCTPLIRNKYCKFSTTSSPMQSCFSQGCSPSLFSVFKAGHFFPHKLTCLKTRA